MMRALLGLVLTGLWLPGCAALPSEDPAELERTWQRAGVIVVRARSEQGIGRMEDPEVQSQLAGLNGGAKRPVIVYLHGCNGLPWTHLPVFYLELAARGFVFVAPDSFARAYRPEQCGAQTQWTTAARFAEIRYARDRLRAFDWVDPERLFLMGQSEGGYYAGAFQGAGFAGRIVMSAPCFEGRGDPRNTLALWSKRDTWMRGLGCSQARHKLALDGDIHAVIFVEEARAAIRDFLLERGGRGAE
ncbi:MAG: hypothetical protein QNJ30_19625 [Kiloniellales bacterium]|nr:hypothetical protein [Kiloniellales bacterium]